MVQFTNEKSGNTPGGKEAPPKKVSHYHAQKPPRLWTVIYIATIVWAVAIWLLYPVWPSLSRYSIGVLGFSTRLELEEQVEGLEESRLPNKQWILETDVAALRDDPVQYAAALKAGKTAFALNCSQCHGPNGKGAPGFPNLTDDDWLWYGEFEELEVTIRHGIRQPGNDGTRFGDMPGFLRAQMLTREDILNAAHYILSLSGSPHNSDRANHGAAVFEENCAACHGYDANGIADMGAPNLTDNIWLYGGDLQTVYETISQGRAGVMPAWEHRLDDATIRQLTAYIQSLANPSSDKTGDDQ